MILKNPDNGATIEIAILGKKWFFPKSTTQKFPVEIGEVLKERYGFLEEINAVEKATVAVIVDGFKCSACEYQNKVKIGVLGHLRSHPEGIEVIEAKSVGEATRRPTLYEMRNAKTLRPDDDSELTNQFPQVEFYGEGFEEHRSMRTNTRFDGRL